MAFLAIMLCATIAIMLSIVVGLSHLTKEQPDDMARARDDLEHAVRDLQRELTGFFAATTDSQLSGQD